LYSQDEVVTDLQHEVPIDDGEISEDSGETPRVRPLADTDLDGLTGSIESMSLSNLVDESGHQEACTTPSQTRAPSDTSAIRPPLRITIPTNVLHWRNSVDRLSASGVSSRRRSYDPSLLLLDELLHDTPYMRGAELIGRSTGSPTWIGRIKINDEAYGTAESDTEQGALDEATRQALYRLLSARFPQICRGQWFARSPTF